MAKDGPDIRDDANRRRREQSAEAREIGPLPKVKSKARKRAALGDLRAFLESYFPQAFPLKWSDDHLRIIAKIQSAAVDGGQFAMAMPRGNGKTTICERAAIWVLLAGLHRFVTLIAASAAHAQRLLQNIKTELFTNDRLAEDFPEACFPIQALEDEPRRCKGQTCGGERTGIQWGARQIVLPSVPKHYGSLCAGGIITVVGITGSLRGQSMAQRGGLVVRPSFVLIDDPQTRKTAASPPQCAKREQIIAGDVLGLAGPGKRISAVMPCTVIHRGDMADQLLDRKRHPEWNGERTKMLVSFPTDEKLWAHYRELQIEAINEGRPTTEATAFYRKNRAAMDAGARVSWPERKHPEELSAIQHAMNLLFLDRAAFLAEYQNEPLEDQTPDEQVLTPDAIARKLNGREPRTLDIAWTHVTAFIDVQKPLLYWLVVGWGEDFSGGILDYGSWPDQDRPYFSLSDAKRTLQTEFPQHPLEAQLYAGLNACTAHLAARDWPRDDGTAVKLERVLVDANWGESTDVVYQFCRQSPHAAILMPSHGRYIGAASKPLNDYQRKPGDRVGINWRIPSGDGRRAVRHVVFDANWWKSFIFARLAAPMGSRSCLALPGQHPGPHRMLSDHLTAEYGVKTIGRGRTVTEWKAKPSRPDNHWLDCLVGCAVGASISGCGLIEQRRTNEKQGTRSFSAMQQKRRSA